MSWQALNWATAVEVGDSTRKLVLLLLANYAGMDDGVCFPSQRRLAREAEVSERTIRRVLGRLEDDGLIERRRRHRTSDGTRTTDLIRLCLPVNLAARADRLPDTGDRPTGQALAAHEPLLEPLTHLHLAREGKEGSGLSFEEQAAQARRLAARFRSPGGLTEEPGSEEQEDPGPTEAGFSGLGG